MTRTQEHIWRRVRRRVPRGIEGWSVEQLWRYADDTERARVFGEELRDGCQAELITRAYTSRMTTDQAAAYRALLEDVITLDEFIAIVGRDAARTLATGLSWETVAVTVRRIATIEDTADLAEATLWGMANELRDARGGGR